jgi:hypothetical protein
MNGTSLFDGIMSKTKAAQRRGLQPVAVFDLDGTLFDNGPRTWNILKEFAKEKNEHHLSKALDARGAVNLPYLLGDLFEEMKIPEKALVEGAKDYWAARFFTNEYQAHDLPMPGSISFVNDFYSAGGTVVYLSGRDAPNMSVGCVDALISAGFPMALARTALVLKPTFEMADVEFKRDAASFISQLGEVVTSLDNEPGNCNLFIETWPDALIALIETQFAPGAPDLNEGVERFQEFVRTE